MTQTEEELQVSFPFPIPLFPQKQEATDLKRFSAEGGGGPCDQKGGSVWVDGTTFILDATRDGAAIYIYTHTLEKKKSRIMPISQEKYWLKL